MAESIDEYFTATVSALVAPGSADSAVLQGLSPQAVLDVFDAQLGSRHLDLRRALAAVSTGKGFYTIGSAGHEANAAVAAALRPDRPGAAALPLGRASTGPRARRCRAATPLRDVLLGLVAAADEPIAGGRHKVFGHHDLAVIPQTSTIASHLPRALGRGVRDRAGPQARRADRPGPHDALVGVQLRRRLGSTTRPRSGAINTAACTRAYQGLPLPLLFVCEDNGLGHQRPTPPGWVERAYGDRDGPRATSAPTAPTCRRCSPPRRAAVGLRARTDGAPAFLHLRTVRLMGHAGTDVETGVPHARRDRRRLRRATRCSRTARCWSRAGCATADELLDRYEAQARPRSCSSALEVAERARAATAREAVIAPRSRAARRRGRAPPTAGRGRRRARCPRRGAADAGAGDQPRARRRARPHPERARCSARTSPRKGGVYGVTRGLQQALRRGAGVRHAARRAVDPRARARRGASRACCRSPRSSTSPTCTTPRTSSAARRRRCSSSPTGSTATRWSCASPATATRRASAATSTTTTRSPCCATSPGW